MTQQSSETQAISVEKVLPYAPDRVWRTLTDSAMLARWLMPNDFVAEVGHRFTFKTRPMGGWDGVVHCEVLVCDPPRLLRYSWKGGSDDNPKYGSRLDSVVTWTLTARDGGTLLRMEHAGFRLPGNRFAFDAMKPGWERVLDSIAQVTAEAD
ncbi:SRPBCC domain-containing protein [Bradyrhizobium prioriisuperbiae]|uniref:SRPBCC family protein n=1 Tax=Bradyrhizobium prioriisuperbiae TaxID=2854389 RepID=UPI0028E2BB7B|nr:SRPBCC domain-containing protein [Bradyrhizobium prioritasuperba]